MSEIGHLTARAAEIYDEFFLPALFRAWPRSPWPSHIFRASTAVDSDSFCNMHPELLEKTLLRKYYSTERIVSQQAKRSFVEPDLQALPHDS